jgi:hypothetical protein
MLAMGLIWGSERPLSNVYAGFNIIITLAGIELKSFLNSRHFDPISTEKLEKVFQSEFNIG